MQCNGALEIKTSQNRILLPGTIKVPRPNENVGQGEVNAHETAKERQAELDYVIQLGDWSMSNQRGP